MYMTGYFATTNSFTKVHIATRDNHGKITPVCGSKIARNKEWQWCANQVIINYVECIHCKRIINRLQKVSPFDLITRLK